MAALLFPGHFDDLVDVVVDVLLRGVEVADDYADDVVALELSGRAEALFDVLHLLGHPLGQLKRHLSAFILDLEQHDRVSEGMHAEQGGMSLDGRDQLQRLVFVRLDRLPDLLHSVMHEGVV